MLVNAGTEGSGGTEGPHYVGFSYDGRMVMATCVKSIRVWEASTGEELHVLNVHTNYVKSVAFFNTDNRIITGSSDRTLVICDASSDERPYGMEDTIGKLTYAAVSSDGGLIASGSWDRLVRLWDSSTGEELRALKGHGDPIGSVEFTSSRLPATMGQCGYGEHRQARYLECWEGTEEPLRRLHFQTRACTSHRLPNLWSKYGT